MRIGSLFSGIGGLEMGLERATGGHVVWQVEIDPFCRTILAKHWPEAVRHEDVRAVGAHNLKPVDIICGGFPCQPFSLAGKRRRESDPRHLWPEYARIIRELRPRFVVGENVAALLAGGFDAVLGDLAACGYDALWDCVPAAAVGAPHRRDRLFVVAWRQDAVADGNALREQPESVSGCGGAAVARVAGAHVADPARGGLRRGRASGLAGQPARTGEVALADANGVRELQPRRCERDERGRAGGAAVADADDAGPQGHRRPVDISHASGREGARRHGAARRSGDDRRQGPAEPSVGRATSGLPVGLDGAFAGALACVRATGHRWPARPGEPQHSWEAPRTARGVKDRAQRLKTLGNAVVPQVGEVIGHVVNTVMAAMEGA